MPVYSYGAAYVAWKTKFIGNTYGGVKIEDSYEFTLERNDLSGVTPVNGIITGANGIITVPLTAVTWDQLTAAIPSLRYVNTDDYVAGYNPHGARLATITGELLIIPKVGGTRPFASGDTVACIDGDTSADSITDEVGGEQFKEVDGWADSQVVRVTGSVEGNDGFYIVDKREDLKLTLRNVGVLNTETDNQALAVAAVGDANKFIRVSLAAPLAAFVVGFTNDGQRIWNVQFRILENPSTGERFVIGHEPST